MSSEHLVQLRMLCARRAGLQAALKATDAAILRSKEVLIIQVVASDDGVWTAKGVDERLRADGILIEPGELQRFLDAAVRQKRLKRVGFGYQLIRPGVLSQYA